MRQLDSGTVCGIYVDTVLTERNSASGWLVTEAPVRSCHVAKFLASLVALFLRTVFSPPTRPLIEVHERVAHVLHARQRFLEPLAGLGEFLTHNQINSQFLQRHLFELFRIEALSQGEDKLPCVDLAGAEP
ncbi:MAG: hypothetical protein ABIZ05_04040 [Pseudonocardiaceae bacterium]